MKKILVMGLPGSGKTTLAAAIVAQLGTSVLWINADELRKQHNDWDFSETGRIRQSQRMAALANASNADYVVCDFVAALPIQREIFAADYVIWVDTITESRFEDTNQAFISPEVHDFRVTTQDAETWGNVITASILT